MKRRVLRAHANKRQLRLIFTTNHLSNPHIFRVLCDASFLRTVIHSYWRSHNTRDIADFHSEGVGGTMAFMRDVVVSAFNIVDHKHVSASQSQKEVYTKHGLDEGKKKASEQISSCITVNFYYLSETEHTLRRIMSSSNISDDIKATVKNPLAGVEGAFPVSSQPNKQDKQQGHSFKPMCNNKTEINAEKAIHDLFSGMTKLVHPKKDIENKGYNSKQVVATPKDSYNASKNVQSEAKAIEAFARQHYSHGRGCSSLHSHSSAPIELPTSSGDNFFFIASQSHDVRRLLPAQAALLRWAQHPDCVWIELKSATYSYSDNAARSVAHGDLTGRDGSPINLCGADTGLLSAADVAFMKHLGVLQKEEGCARQPLSSGSASPPDPTDSSSTVEKSGMTEEGNLRAGAVSLTVDDGYSPAAGNRRRKRQHNPNPLSMKKKQKRESFRIG